MKLIGIYVTQVLDFVWGIVAISTEDVGTEYFAIIAHLNKKCIILLSSCFALKNITSPQSVPTNN